MLNISKHINKRASIAEDKTIWSPDIFVTSNLFCIEEVKKKKKETADWTTNRSRRYIQPSRTVTQYSSVLSDNAIKDILGESELGKLHFRKLTSKLLRRL